ncbi:hypothetical protein LSAT2_025116, partial [Lamellibrachia satsuma]
MTSQWNSLLRNVEARRALEDTLRNLQKTNKGLSCQYVKDRQRRNK